ncbi:hypothetical protein R84981_002882 [Carnimonas sp. R-84981]
MKVNNHESLIRRQWGAREDRDDFLHDRLEIASYYGCRLGEVEVDQFHPCGICVFVRGKWVGDLDDGDGHHDGSALEEIRK